jgi:hypothetical protein
VDIGGEEFNVAPAGGFAEVADRRRHSIGSLDRGGESAGFEGRGKVAGGCLSLGMSVSGGVMDPTLAPILMINDVIMRDLPGAAGRSS